MDFGDSQDCKYVKRGIGQELKQMREVRGWSRLQLVSRLPSGIGDRTLLSYEHGTRELGILRFLELCQSLGVGAPRLLNRSLQRAQIMLDNMDLHIDLRALLDDESPKFRPMAQWARNKLNRHPDGVAELEPVAVVELADFVGCAHDELRAHLARFLPDLERDLEITS